MENFALDATHKGGLTISHYLDCSPNVVSIFKEVNKLTLTFSLLMIARLSPASLAWLLFSASAQASYIIEGLSFGHKGAISPNGRAVPGWHLSGENHTPQLLSDRIILTPPAPGGTRGAIFADNPITQPEWVVETEFRASGQERGSGNLNFWFVDTGRSAVGQSSIYTVSKFDGLALVVDQYGPRGGSIRGFLNDGSANFKDHHNVDSLAFGHCDYAYRNLGRPSKLRIENGAHGLRVDIDGTSCFHSEKVNLPPGYFFGISAAASENPDSFEVYKFSASTTNSISREEPNVEAKRQHIEKLDKFPGAPEALPDADASTIKAQADQFADLHNRLQGMTHQIANMFGEFERLSRQMNERHAELMAKVAGTNAGDSSDKPQQPTGEALLPLSRRVENIERIALAIQRDVEGKDYREHLTNLQQSIEGVRGGLTEHLPETIAHMISTAAPKMGMFIFVVIAFQVMLAGAYIIYKRRRANAPKKYL
ncbi:concanavalin A-like lectin/glucanase [Aureobasidium pullulans]|uniref:Concanavalin A-like lectin/glucanase n=1 Tax=Aureobasidium pullulans TaxID=5580 RepID=A0A4V4ILS9_AURPU|nr:concanavalin A-like lectin/glucanase [Aureobasidium pullulans]